MRKPGKGWMHIVCQQLETVFKKDSHHHFDEAFFRAIRKKYGSVVCFFQQTTEEEPEWAEIMARAFITN